MKLRELVNVAEYLRESENYEEFMDRPVWVEKVTNKGAEICFCGENTLMTIPFPTPRKEPNHDGT